MRGVAKFFFMHIGSFVAVIVFIVVAGRGGLTPEAVAHALRVAFVAMVAYVALAWSQGEVKHFDYGLLAMFAVGALASLLGIGSVVALFHVYFGAVLFTTLALTALVPLVLGWEPFTAYFARRQLPRWQLDLPDLPALMRVMAGYWVGIFAVAGALAASAPTDPRFTLLYPNLLVFGLGMTATFWLPPLYFRFRPPGFPNTVDALIMGMPFAFDRRAAGDARATIQFCVTDGSTGTYHVAVDRGRCRSYEGRATAADVTIHTPAAVWMQIVRGELDGEQALMQGSYRAEGDLAVLAKLTEWFPARR
ncbi:MAG TPA: SCP2 sterol-binding domain-containing protein [Candidatus Binatia bacterium]|nr:SCP2 sterol-binding domain-containing protein [Candidatus Binatia bacterium]